MSKQIINITDITEYFYCPRKVYLKLVKKIYQPPTQRMMVGMLNHKAAELFNNHEEILVSGITENISEPDIKKKYLSLLQGLLAEILQQNWNIVKNFGIDEKEFSALVKKTLEPEIDLRIISIKKTIEAGFLGKELWRNLTPKYLTEYKIYSEELGLQGRVDRIKFADFPVPIEKKTREKIYDSDKLQLAGYALLLEKEFSKPVNAGVIEVLGQVHEIELTPELKQSVLDIADKIRNLTEENAEMPSNFAKCNLCAFKEHCG